MNIESVIIAAEDKINTIKSNLIAKEESASIPGFKQLELPLFYDECSVVEEMQSLAGVSNDLFSSIWEEPEVDFGEFVTQLGEKFYPAVYVTDPISSLDDAIGEKEKLAALNLLFMDHSVKDPGSFLKSLFNLKDEDTPGCIRKLMDAVSSDKDLLSVMESVSKKFWNRQDLGEFVYFSFALAVFMTL